MGLALGVLQLPDESNLGEGKDQGQVINPVLQPDLDKPDEDGEQPSPAPQSLPPMTAGCALGGVLRENSAAVASYLFSLCREQSEQATPAGLCSANPPTGTNGTAILAEFIPHLYSTICAYFHLSSGNGRG